MTVCPLCEHPQSAGAECECCGRPLLPPPPLATPVPALAELEPARAPPVPAPVGVPLVDLERTRLPPAAPGAVAALADLDRGRFEGDGERAAPAPAGVCRYCRHVQAEGLLCERCGMRLPRPDRRDARSAAGPSGEEADWVRCPQCRTRGRPGRACVQCQTMLRVSG